MTETPLSFSPDSCRDTLPQPSFANGKKLLFIFFLVVTALLLGVFFLIKSSLQAPDDFPLGEPIVIESGATARDIAAILSEKRVVKSETLLYYTLLLFHDPADIKASTYIFPEPLPTYEIARRLNEGDFDTDLIRFTHIEGERANQIAKRAATILPAFNYERFIATAEPLEGKLFPETYFIPITFTDEDLLALLLETFETQIAPLQEQIAATPYSLNEIITLASIIEREANTLESKQLVASVLLNRMEIGMPLQADASIEYILDKPLSELTADDLKIDSLYNTYTHTGLPPTPIGNPGLEAITAVISPTSSPYFYYLTDEEGEFHFAETYNEHLTNIERYLR